MVYMSVELTRVAELLSGLYVERLDGQWKTVVNFLEELMSGKVISLEGLASFALSYANNKSYDYIKLVRRAQRLNNRVGQVGRREVLELAYVAVQLSFENLPSGILAAHVSRIGFNRKLKQEHARLVERSNIITKSSIKALSRSIPNHGELNKPVTLENLQDRLIQRDEYMAKEFWRRDEINATTLACIVGEADLWDTIKRIVGNHDYPYPYEYEVVATQACLATLKEDGQVKLDKLPVIPDDLHVSDVVNFPILSSVSMSQETWQAPDYIESVNLPAADLAKQLLLEILYLRQKDKK